MSFFDLHLGDTSISRFASVHNVTPPDKNVLRLPITLFKEYLKLLNRLYDTTWFGAVYV